jgi:hypothetical protein
MYCPNQITYTIKKGDTLYSLAKTFNTTLDMLFYLNPGIDPYNLQIGETINICHGSGIKPPIGILPPVMPVPPIGIIPPPCPPPAPPTIPVIPPIGILPPVTPPIGILPPMPPSICQKLLDLTNRMRLAWSQHVYWTRMLIISIIERLKDQPFVTKRLLQNPDDIANVFKGFYDKQVTNKISKLLTEHLQIGASLITALRDKKTEEADILTKRWYINADKMADAFSSINPYYDREELREMLYTHLELTTEEVAMRLAGNYKADIEAFDKVEHEAISMSDYFALGIIRQFPDMFM